MKATSVKKMSDQELVEAYLSSHSDRFFTVLYQRYIQKIYGKCLSMLQDATIAKDAAQEIFFKIFINLSRFNRQAQFSTWIYSITYNHCIDLIRRSQKLRQLIISDDDDKVYKDLTDEPDDYELTEMRIDRLKIVLDKLPIDDKAVLLMKYQDDLPIKEIGIIINKTESAVKMKLKRAKHKSQIIYQNTFKQDLL